jgi:hypothetical protein
VRSSYFSLPIDPPQSQIHTQSKRERFSPVGKDEENVRYLILTLSLQRTDKSVNIFHFSRSPIIYAYTTKHA